MLEEDSVDSSAGSGSDAGDFPEGGEPARFGQDHTGKHSLGGSSAEELPGPKLKVEVSGGRFQTLLRLIAASLPLPRVTSRRPAGLMITACLPGVPRRAGRVSPLPERPSVLLRVCPTSLAAPERGGIEDVVERNSFRGISTQQPEKRNEFRSTKQASQPPNGAASKTS
jgi:hypothetical protein